jgi:hypothetical protein
MVQKLGDDEANVDSPPIRANVDQSERHFLPAELKSDKPLPLIFSTKESDLEPIRDVFAPNFIENLARVRRGLDPSQGEPFFKIILPHIKNDKQILKVGVQSAILSTTAELITSSHGYFQCFIEMEMLEHLPYEIRELVDPIFHVLVPVFQQAPLMIKKPIFDALVPLIPVRPMCVLKLLNIYTCLHAPMPLFWTAADILITQSTHFQVVATVETYLRLVFTLSRIVDVFRAGRFKYLVPILTRLIATTSGSTLKLAFDIFTALLNKPPPEVVRVDVSLFLPRLKDPEYSFYAMSVLARLPQQQPTYDVVLTLLGLAQQSHLACLILCQYCEIEMVAVKMAEISGCWIKLNLPTLEHTLRLVLVVVCHQRARSYLQHNPDTQNFLVEALAINRPDITVAVGTIQMAFTLRPDYFDRLRKVSFIRKYIDASCAFNNGMTLVTFFELVKFFSRVAYDEDYLLLLPILKTLLGHQTGGWGVFAVPLLATMSRYKEVRSQIRQHKLMRLVAAVNSDDPKFLKHRAKLERNMDVHRTK